MVKSLASSPNGKQLASTSGGKINIWDVVTGAYLSTLDDRNEENPLEVNLSVIFSPDGKQLSSASRSNEYGMVRVWDAVTWRPLLRLKHAYWATSVAFSSDGSRLASGSGDGTIRIWSPRTGECFFKSNISYERNYDVTSVAFSPDNKWLASASMGGIKLWTFPRLQLFTTLHSDRDLPPSLNFSPDSRQLAWGSDTTQIYDLSTHNSRQIFDNNTKPIAFLPDSRQLLLSKYRAPEIWDIVEGTRLVTLGSQASPVRSAIIVPNPNRVATASFDGIIKIWDSTANRAFSQKIRDYGALLNKIAVSPNGKHVASSSVLDSTIRLWDTITWTCLHSYEIREDIQYIGFSADSKILILASTSGVIRKWDVTRGECIEILRNPWFASQVVLAFSPDLTYAAFWCNLTGVKIWNILTKEDYQPIAADIYVSSIAFLPDSQYVALRSFGNVITIWDFKAPNLVLKLIDENKAQLVAFLSDGSYLITEKGRIALPKYPELHNLSPTAQSRDNDFDVRFERDWIVCNGRKYLWVPPDYRPRVSAAMANNIVFGCGRERMWMFTFDTRSQNKKRSELKF